MITTSLALLLAFQRPAVLPRPFAPSPLLRRSPLGCAATAAGGDLVLCEALVRVYEEGARRVHPAHYDADALVTAVLELDASTPADGDAPSRARASHTRRCRIYSEGARMDRRLAA